jgi:hypothetical protein
MATERLLITIVGERRLFDSQLLGIIHISYVNHYSWADVIQDEPNFLLSKYSALFKHRSISPMSRSFKTCLKVANDTEENLNQQRCGERLNLTESQTIASSSSGSSHHDNRTLPRSLRLKLILIC